MKNINILSKEEFIKSINEKTENQSYSSGCLMGYFNSNFNNPTIDESDLYNNDKNEYGLEIEPHVTVLYGLTDDEIDESEIIKLFTLIDGPEVQTEEISLFKNDKFDVVKWDIISDELTILNKMLTSMFPYKSDYPDYHAHCTVAYCLPNTGDKYTTTLNEPETQKIAYWVYSKANGKKIKITPGIGAEILREATNENVMYGCDKLGNSVCLPIMQNIIKEYKGYNISFKPHNQIVDAFYVSIYNEDEYKMGLRGPVGFDSGYDAAKNYIDSL